MGKELKQSEKEFQDNIQNPEGQAEKQVSNEDYKNLQSFATKARQKELELAKKLVSKDINELENLDESTQSKIIKDLYGYEDLDELKIMSPELFEENSEEDDKADEYKAILKKTQILERQLSKKEVEDEIEKFTSGNTALVNSISGFSDKIKEELKFISSELPIKERVNRATKIVVGGTDINIEAFLSLQGKTKIKTSTSVDNDDRIKDAQNQFRSMLGLKSK